MPNLAAPAGYPYALKDPVPHGDLNDIVDEYRKAPNADEGSSHAPTGNLSWSGSGGGGFEFDTVAPFPFYGYLDVSDHLRFTAPSSGSVRFNSTVALDIFGAVTLKTGVLANVDSGASMVFLSGATCTVASGATCNLTGDVNVRGTMRVRSAANGGPGSIIVEDGAFLTLNSDATVVVFTNTWTWTVDSKQTYVAGAEVAGPVVRSGRETKSGAAAATAWRRTELADANADIDVSADSFTIPATLTGSRTYRVCHSGVAGTQIPVEGDRIIVRRGDPAGVSAHNPRVERESGQDLWLWGNGYHGAVILEFNGTQWDVVFGHNVDGSSLSGTGWYGN